MPPTLPQRRTLRLSDYDYSQSGLYFITIVTHHRSMLFGRIVDREMRLNHFGEIVQEQWERTSTVRPDVELDAFVVMPNHFHGILRLVGATRATSDVTESSLRVAHTSTMPISAPDPTGTATAASARATRHGTIKAMEPGRVAPTVAGVVTSLRAGSIGAIIGQFKSVVSKQIRLLCEDSSFSVWQRNYYEHILRDQADYEQVAGYILENPYNWVDDDENPDKM